MNKLIVISVLTVGLLVACTPRMKSGPQIASTMPPAASSATLASPTTQHTPLVTLLPTIQPTPSYTAAPTLLTTEGVSVASINILIPKISPASEIIDTASISSFFLKSASPLTIALDNKFVYWVDHNDPSLLYRISQSGGMPEVVARSLYKGGRLDLFDLQISEHWMILSDTDTPGIPGNWKVRAINLDDLSQTVLLSSDANQIYSIAYFDISLDQNSVIWAVTTIKDNVLDENVVSFVNLETGEKRELLRKKVDTWAWSRVSLSGNQAVIQQSFDETQGGKIVLHLLDVTNGNMSVLLTAERSGEPGFSFPWVIWTQTGSNGYMQSFAVYNLVDGRKWRVPSQGSSPFDPRMNGSWVYWRDQPSSEGNAIYIYDIEKNTTYVLESPGSDQLYEAVYMLGDTIAWVRNIDYSQAVSDHYLEWATIR